jgi:hypothetical protein
VGKIKVNGVEYSYPENAKPTLPQSGGQYAAFWSRAFEVLGGGSAGGGKSWFLVVDALGLQYTVWGSGRPAFMHRGYRAVLFRRESTQLDRLISEAKEYYPQYGGVYVGGRQGEPGPCFEFPEFGSKIFFCHLQNEDDKENHQGQEYQYVGFDELTHFTVTQYLYLFSRLRSPFPGVFPRVRATCNPTGEGLWWVRKRFIDNWQPGTVKWFLPPEDPKEDPRGKDVPRGQGGMSRQFIPFWLNENKILSVNDPLYAERVRALGKTMEKALLGGDWYAFGGDMFPEFDRHKELVEPAEIPDEWNLILSIDPGYSSPCSAGLIAADFNDNYYRIATYYEMGRNPEQNAVGIKKFVEDCKYTRGRMPKRIVAGKDAWAKKDLHSIVESGKTFSDVFQEVNHWILEPATTDRINGWWNWRRQMPDHWFVFKYANQPLLDEMASAVTDERVLEDLKGRGNDPAVRDHALDENRYGLMAIVVPKPIPITRTGWFEQFVRPGKEVTEWKPGSG